LESLKKNGDGGALCSCPPPTFLFYFYDCWFRRQCQKGKKKKEKKKNHCDDDDRMMTKAIGRETFLAFLFVGIVGGQPKSRSSKLMVVMGSGGDALHYHCSC
jgi:hypothetical protein